MNYNTLLKKGVFSRLTALLVLLNCMVLSVNGQRKDIVLESSWYSILADSSDTYEGILQKASPSGFSTWQQVSIPHTWDKYEGYRLLKHGNRHGSAWYIRTINIGKE